MWYIAWMLGVPFACAVAIINAMRYEFKHAQDNSDKS